MTSPVELRGFGSSELAPRDRNRHMPAMRTFRAINRSERPLP